MDLTNVKPQSYEWWLYVLYNRLMARRKRIKIYGEYYEGKHRLMFHSERFKKEFGDLLRELRDNWCELVIDAMCERCTPLGFRWGDDPAGDEDAHRIWQYNHMDAESDMLHTEIAISGIAYTLVDPFVEDDESPSITVEHPDQMIVATVEGNRWRRAAALKVWEEEWGDTFATLYMPDNIYKFKKTRGIAGEKIILPDGVTFDEWAPREVDHEVWPLPNPLKDVPVVPFTNRPRMLVPWKSELENVIPNNDAANKLLADLMIAAEHSGFRQRYALGFEPDKDEQGNPIMPFDSSAQSLWWMKKGKEAAQFGEFGETDLRNFVLSIENRVQSIASQTRTPPHYFFLKGTFPSGESIKSAETGLVKKVSGRHNVWGESYEETIRMALRAKGDPKGDDNSSETIWKDPESRTEGEMVDAAVKLKTLGLADETLQERIGMTPKQIARNKVLMAQQSLLGGSLFEVAGDEIPGTAAPVPAEA